MADSEETRAQLARTVPEDQIVLYLHDASPAVIKALLENRHFREEHAEIVANRKNLPGDIFDTLYKDRRWADSYPVRLALARNPKTPLFTALSVARFLRIFDQVEIARNHFLSPLYRRKLESVIIEKIPTLTLGIKKTLAKTAGGEVLLKLLQDGYPEVVSVCLGNPHLTEAHLYKTLSRETTPAGSVRTIAEHGAWTTRYNIKFALLRNTHTPLARSVQFLPDMKTRDLRDLYRDRSLPPEIRPSIHRELWERGEEAAEAVEESDTVYEIDEQEMQELERGDMERLIREEGEDHA